MKSVARAMTIAGSDSGGGAGIQADLKTFAGLGVYGTSVVTAVTAQNTMGITEILEVPVSVVNSQFDAVVADIGTDVVKTGMLNSATVIEAVVEKIREHGLTTLIVDPSVVTKRGDRLLQQDAVEALRALLIPMATVVTPNVPEAELLLGRDIRSIDDSRDAAREIVAMGAKAAVVTGGHLSGPATDILYDGVEFRAFTSPRLSTTSTHGTGCTFASTTAAGLAKGLSVRDAVTQAKKYVTDAIRHAFPLGRGHGPVNHFYQLWNGVAD